MTKIFQIRDFTKTTQLDLQKKNMYEVIVEGYAHYQSNLRISMQRINY